MLRAWRGQRNFYPVANTRFVLGSILLRYTYSPAASLCWRSPVTQGYQILQLSGWAHAAQFQNDNPLSQGYHLKLSCNSYCQVFFISAKKILALRVTLQHSYLVWSDLKDVGEARKGVSSVLTGGGSGGCQRARRGKLTSFSSFKPLPG